MFRGNSSTSNKTEGIWYGTMKPLAHRFKSSRLNFYVRTSREKSLAKKKWQTKRMKMQRLVQPVKADMPGFEKRDFVADEIY